MKMPPPHIITQILASRPDMPKNPCEICGLWSPSCNQDKCSIVLKHRAKLAELWRAASRE